ncbi:MAG: prolipoprotein diacylglyceryl transferase [Rhodospirillales bacterium RIFCSPLOWO2_12_FULL_58_28]|nr:MAG: prolipoprotein diacylglyceryl transferase [Rhodospirillales bacterium RIFCSPLOWO2_02_FULL_58_16]OHC77805.1 MAG: prolipoprotein diacylglyceryl transferase [Rhodospirillales bacterium RIFCSPLOWO2_12_FULL_58_28]
MIFAIPYPGIDPVIFQFGPVLGLGPFLVRWYALAYVFGLLLAWWYMRRLTAHPPQPALEHDIDDFITWATVGVIIGGRLGYVLFYKLGFFMADPMAVLQVWKGGMSFHGGLLGVALAGLIFVRRRGIPVLPFADIVACASPIGLFLGRLANFINGELFGRVSDAPWAMVFPTGGPFPRHPSQLYEAMLEGVALFVLLHLLWRNESVRRRPGLLTGVFLVGYAAFRAVVELFRQPDVHIGFLSGGSTMGQWLSLPMALIGLYLIFRALGKNREAL